MTIPLLSISDPFVVITGGGYWWYLWIVAQYGQEVFYA